MAFSLGMIQVPGCGWKAERTWMDTPKRSATSMERGCMTWAPAPASSSISAAVIRSSLRASETMRGSAV